jgi:hypothetical protein
LREIGNWKTVKGDALSKGSRSALRKRVSFPSAETDELAPPDPESLFYELLREMEFLSVALEPRLVNTAAVEQHFDQPPVVQAWHWLRAWLDIHLWQDGIGAVPDRNRLRTSGNDLVSRHRLTCLADRATDRWLISEKSVSRARKQGFTADQMLEWLTAHLSHETPALLVTAIRNWMGRTSAFAAKSKCSKSHEPKPATRSCTAPPSNRCLPATFRLTGS